MASRKRQRSNDLIGPLLSKLLVEEPHNQDDALNLSHLVHITDDPAHAETVSRHQRVGELMNVCWSFIGMQEPEMLTAHDEEQRSTVLRGFAKLVERQQSCRSLLIHEDMHIVAHNIIKAVQKSGNVAERDVAQACSLTSASMENPEDRVAFSKALIASDTSGDFLLRLLESWPLEDHRRVQTLDRFLSQPVEDLMWNAQTESRNTFAQAWLKLLTVQLPEEAGPLCAKAMGNTLQIKDPTFCETLLQEQGQLFRHLITNLVLGITHNKPEPTRIRASMFTIQQLMQRNELVQRLALHPRFGPLVTITISNLGIATQEEDELLQVLKLFLEHESTKHKVLSGSHVMQIIDSISQLLDSASQHLQNLSLDLLTKTLQTVEPGVLLGAHASMTRLLPRLCGFEPAKEHMQSLLSLLQWWPQFVQLVPLDFKRRWLTEKLHQRCHQPEPLLLEVQREHLLDSLCEGLDQCTDSLRLGINVSFKDDKEEREDEEDDIDDSASDRKEFFRLAAAEFMDPELGLFSSKDGGRSFHLSPGDVDPSSLQRLQLCGKLIGLALLHGEEVPAMKLSTPLRRLLLGAPLRPLEDMAAVDPKFYEKKVATMLEGRYEADEGDGQPQLAELEFTFVDALDGVELCLGGAERVVTEENKMQYLDLLCHRRLVDSVRDQVDALVSGVNALVPLEVQGQLQRVLNPTELGLCLCGEPLIDVKEWQAKSSMASGTPAEIWECFWRAVEGMNNAQKHGLLEYAAGGCASEGISGITLAPAVGLVPEAEPSRSTLKLPRYDSPHDMRAALLSASEGR